MHHGEVAMVNFHTGIFAIFTANGMIKCENLEDCELTHGDIIEGNFRSLGVQTFTNKTRNCTFKAAVEQFYCAHEVPEILE